MVDVVDFTVVLEARSRRWEDLAVCMKKGFLLDGPGYQNLLLEFWN